MTKQMILPVQGMTCASCSAHVEKALKKVPGVTDAVVNLATERANVTFDPTQARLQQMVDAVHDAGYAIGTEKVKTTFVEDAKNTIEREREFAAGSGLQDALKNIDQSCEGGG